MKSPSIRTRRKGRLPLVVASRPAPLALKTFVARRVAQILRPLHGVRVVYRYWIETDPRRELAGSGIFTVEETTEHLHCRILGDLFKPSPFEFCFHRFYVTERGMVHAVFDFADERLPALRGVAESFLHFELIGGQALRREAVKFRERFTKRQPGTAGA